MLGNSGFVFAKLDQPLAGVTEFLVSAGLEHRSRLLQPVVLAGAVQQVFLTVDGVDLNGRVSGGGGAAMDANRREIGGAVATILMAGTRFPLMPLL
jgi:hypothetical protein